MGSCQCQKTESEQEVIMRILSKMNLSDIETTSAYDEFFKCLNKEHGFLDYFLYFSYLNKIVGDNNYKNVQLKFFENLWKNDTNGKNSKVIGTMIILLSKGLASTKVEILFQHYSKFYLVYDEKTVKEFIYDIIDANTDLCINTFRENFGHEISEQMTKIYTKERKRKLMKEIYSNYENVFIKYYHKSPNNLKSRKLNSSFDYANIDIKLIESDLIPQDDNYFPQLQDKKNSVVKKFCENEKIIREFLQLAFNQLSGNYIRSWLEEEHSKDREYESICI
jgi:hypothetical protein